MAGHSKGEFSPAVQVEVDVSVTAPVAEPESAHRHCERRRCDCCRRVDLYLVAIQEEVDELTGLVRLSSSAIDARLDRMERQLSEILRRLPDTTPAHIRLTAS